MYLDFGGALAAVGLVFAVYQLRRPIWDLVLRLRPWWQRNLFALLAIAGIVLTLVSVMLDHFAPTWQPSWLFEPFPYQVLAYVAFAASPISLLLLATDSKGLFSERNAARFYRVLGLHLATTDEQTAVLNVLLVNFGRICKEAVGAADTDGRRYARAVLDVILSESGIVAELTTKRLRGLQYIFDSAAHYGLSRNNSPIGIPALIRNLYADTSSFLYKQYQAEGLAQAINIYTTLFESATLLSNFEVFNYPALDYTMRTQIGAAGIQVFLEALRRSLRTYLISGEVPAERINRGLEYLSQIFGDQCTQVGREHRGEGVHPRTPAWEAIGKIAHFLGHDCIFIADRADWNRLIRRHEDAGDDEGLHSRLSVASGLAEATCNAFSHLATIDKSVDITWSYLTVVDLLHGLNAGSPTLCSDARGAFSREIWSRIHENVRRRFFPATLRVYLEFIGFLLVFRNGDRGPWANEEKERVRRLLYVDLKPLLDSKERMINDELMEAALLPQVMRYENGRFYYRGRFGKGSESEIAPPRPGATSALEGVMDRFGRG